ncbi:proteasome subunit beta type-3-like isoform X2 [Drosophila obscura]|nr:proteasome subunit beta type-3-like isoform X2 [Drosophila obscura]
MNIRQKLRLQVITPDIYIKNLSNILYEQRPKPYQVDCIVLGLQPGTMRPFISTLDMLGVPNELDDFVAIGKRSPQLHATCEALWKPKMEPADLLQTISSSILADTDPKVTIGALVYVVERGRITESTVEIEED